MPVLVPRGCRQALYVSREASLLWAWRGEACSHKTILHQFFFYDPVVLVALDNAPRSAKAIGFTLELTEDGQGLAYVL